MRSPILLTVSAVLVAVFLSACLDGESGASEEAESESARVTPPQTRSAPGVQGGPSASVVRTGTVKETMNAAGYTYVQVDTGSETFWAAAPSFAVEVGDPVAVPSGMPMQDFHSSALDRDFDVVYFVDGVRVGVGGGQVEQQAGQDVLSDLPAGHPPLSSADEEVAPGDIKQLKGGRTVEEILSQSDDLDGSTVSFRGKVVKFNANIMGSNWLHVQDGTGSSGKNDLTVTTNDRASVGETVTVTGVVATDKDFGAGYSYEVIVQDARVSVE